METQVIIIGAGMSGLSAGIALKKQGIDFKILEATDQVGGRMKTRTVDGYLLDAGFQVMLTTYPELRNTLDYKALKLQHFDPGAIILDKNGSSSQLGDPLRKISSLFPTLLSRVGSISDKMKILKLTRQLKSTSVDEIFEQEDKTTLEKLTEFGFSKQIIHTFFRPFFSGIFLENKLSTSSKMFDFVFKMFAEGSAAVPQAGIQAIPRQIAETLGRENILFSHKVNVIDKNRVNCVNGEVITGTHILLASEPTKFTSQLFGDNSKFVSTTNLHFVAEQDPIGKKLIALNSRENNIVNNLCTISNVATSYASQGHLISVSTVGLQEMSNIESLVKNELKTWYKNAETWSLIDVQHISKALPNQNLVRLNPEIVRNGQVWLAGDYMTNGSVNGAMRSGRMVAEAIAGIIKT